VLTAAVLSRLLNPSLADDKNNDGQLDPEECRALVKEMLTEQQKFAPKLIDMMLDSSIQVRFLFATACDRSEYFLTASLLRSFRSTCSRA
jgi:hypothetical protein